MAISAGGIFGRDRYGYRRITTLLRAEGRRVNHKRVERIWRQKGLKVPQRQPKRQPKRGRLWLHDRSCILLRPEHRNQFWAYDFVLDRTHNGRPLKMLTVWASTAGRARRSRSAGG